MNSLTVTAKIILIFFHIQLREGINLNCGRRTHQHTALITNGLPSKVGDWPWHAGIFHIGKRLNSTYKCGGTLLNSNSILTAAHCVFENNRVIISERILVYLGRNNLISGPYTQEFEVQKVIPHPDYNLTNLNNDIAIIRLATEATLNNYVQPICLWDSSRPNIADVTGKVASVIGWGTTEMGQISYVLRQALIPIVSHSTCLSSNSDFFSNYLTERNFCAGFLNGTSVCNGDSGGSLSLEEDGVYYIRGIVSLTSQSLENTKFCTEYVVFTDVVHYLPWIQLVVPQLKPTTLGMAQDTNCPYFPFASCVPLTTSAIPTTTSAIPTSPTTSSTTPVVAEIEDEVDWRKYGAVTPIKDQGKCAGSWAFAAIGALESHLFINQSILKLLSEQQLIDCTQTLGNLGCWKGSMHTAFMYAQTDGIAGLYEYPYEATTGVCRHHATSRDFKIHSYRNITAGNEEELKEVVKNYGPVSAAIHASRSFGALSRHSIFYDKECEGIPNHAVLIIGYGHDERIDLDYWLIKNSYGTEWGNDGYAKIIRNRNHCGIADYASYPIV